MPQGENSLLFLRIALHRYTNNQLPGTICPTRSQSSNTQPGAEAHAQTQTGAELMAGGHSAPTGWREEEILQRGGGAAPCRNSGRARRQPASVSITTSPREGRKASDEELDACSSSAQLTTSSRPVSAHISTPNSGEGQTQDFQPAAAAAATAAVSVRSGVSEETYPRQGPEPHREPVGRVEVIVEGKRYCGGLDLDEHGMVAVAAQCPEDRTYLARPSGIPTSGKTHMDHRGADPNCGNVIVCANEVSSARKTGGAEGAKSGTNPGVGATSIQPLVGKQVEVGECLVERVEGADAAVGRFVEPVLLGRVCSTTTTDAPPVSSEQAVKFSLQESIEAQDSPPKVEGGGLGVVVPSERVSKPSDGAACSGAAQDVVQVGVILIDHTSTTGYDQRAEYGNVHRRSVILASYVSRCLSNWHPPRVVYFRPGNPGDSEEANTHKTAHTLFFSPNIADFLHDTPSLSRRSKTSPHRSAKALTVDPQGTKRPTDK